jgi:hypothetical protein
MQIDPYAHDVGRWGNSLATHLELLLALLDATRPSSIVEVGAYAGNVTRLLANWAGDSEVRITSIDPYPQEALVSLAEERPNVHLIREPSHEALRHLEPPDMAIVDGDHNYHSVSGELRLIAPEGSGARPLIVLHDVCWPHGRRDSYFTPERIPEQDRQPMVEDAGLFPGEPGVRWGGLPYAWAAAREGGPRNGVLTAAEDFVSARAGIQLAVVPAFFGLGVVWHRDAPWAAAVAELVEARADDPLLARLEENRVLHLASLHVERTQAHRQRVVLYRLLDSSAFGLAERLSRLRLRLGIGAEHSALSKEDVRRVLED